MFDALRTGIQGRNQLIAAIAVVVVAAVAGVLLISDHSGPGAQTASSAPSAPAAPLPALKTLSGGAFVSAYASGWNETSERSPKGAARYQLSSTGARPDSLGIPPAGAVGVTIDETPASLLASAHLPGAPRGRKAASETALELLASFVGTPRGARGLKLASHPQRSALAGADAAIESYGYTYDGLANIQVDILAHHDGAVVLIELDTEPSLAAQGEAALETLARHWHWR